MLIDELNKTKALSNPMSCTQTYQSPTMEMNEHENESLLESQVRRKKARSRLIESQRFNQTSQTGSSPVEDHTHNHSSVYER